MTIRFGLELHEQVFPDWDEHTDANCGEHTLLNLLEEHLGLGYPENEAFLRVEQYRQVLQYYKERHPDVFYAASFDADSLATAAALLSRRDELYMGLWDFKTQPKMPTRLLALAELEQLLAIAVPLSLSPGFAERFVRVLKALEEERILPLQEVLLNEPLELLPPHWQQLFGRLENRGVKITASKTPEAVGDSDLATFQQSLLKQPHTRNKALCDGSLLILRSRNEAYAATYLAKLFALNPHFRPLCLLSNKNRALDNAVIQEGLPSFGVLSASLARPTLQILKLVSTFLWNPINPYKLLEFLSLPRIPLHKDLAIKLAEALSEKPGLFSSVWFRKFNKFKDDFEERINNATKKNRELLQKEKDKAIQQYDFWFDRRRYDIRAVVPIKDVTYVFEYVQRWALEQVDEYKTKIEKLDKKLDRKGFRDKADAAELQALERKREELSTAQSPLLTLHEQARRIVQILDSLPETEQLLSYLQLERLVKTINEPVQMLFRYSEVGHAPFVYNPSAIAETADAVLWWNFVEPGQQVGFARWYARETEYLEEASVRLDSVYAANQRQLWQRMRPVLQARRQLILVLPDAVDGRSVNPHPLWGDLHATFGKALDALQFDLASSERMAFFASFFALPSKAQIEPLLLHKPKSFLFLNATDGLKEREKESFTSLENLFYYPYQWVFRYLIGLNKSSILSVVKDQTLMGNLAHSVMQNLLEEVKKDDRIWEKDAVDAWVETKVPPMFEREGAVLLMYGREAERVGFVNRLKHAAWALISAIQDNNWSIHGIEMPVSGELAGQKIVGTADLVLERAGELAVVDLKWAGKTKFREIIRNQDDLQLTIYSRLITEGKGWAHTAYYIMNDAHLLARNNKAFKEAEALSPETDAFSVSQHIWDKMESTYSWRMNQIKSGKIEIRNELTSDLLEREYLDAHELLSLLELSGKTPSYDIYKVLVSGYK